MEMKSPTLDDEDKPPAKSMLAIVCDMFASDFAFANMEAYCAGGDTSRHLAQGVIYQEEGRDAQPHETEALASEVAQWIRELLKVIKTDQAQQDDMLYLDAAAANLLESTGPKGKVMAAKLRTKARERWRDAGGDRTPGSGRERAVWKIWVNLARPDPTPMDFAPPLAIVLWHDVVKPGVSRRPMPALSIVVLDHYTDALHGPGRRIENNQLIGPDGRLLGRIDNPPSPEVPNLEHYIVECGGLYGALLVREVVHTVWDLHAAGHQTYDQPLFQGGFSALAARLGIKSNKGPTMLRDLCRAYQALSIRMPHAEFGGLWTYQLYRRGRHHDLQLKVAAPLCPNFEQTFTKGAVGKKLVPYPRRSPPLVGRHNHHGAILALQSHVLVRMRNRAEELAAQGAVHIPPDEWERMAARSSLPRQLLPRVREVWIAGDGRAQAFLTRPDDEWFGLAPAYYREHATLMEAARRSAQGRNRAQRRSR